jgi:hypothetical protein
MHSHQQFAHKNSCCPPKALLITNIFSSSEIVFQTLHTVTVPAMDAPLIGDPATRNAVGVAKVAGKKIADLLLATPVADALNPKNTASVLQELGADQVPTPDEIARGWTSNEPLFQQMAAELEGLRGDCDAGPVPRNVRRIFDKRARRAGKSVAKIDCVSVTTQVATTTLKLLFAAGSQTLCILSKERAWRPRQSAANAFIIVLTIADALCGKRDWRDCYEFIAMRYGLSTATYILAIVRLYVDISKLTPAARAGTRAASILGNLLCYLYFFILPKLEARNDKKQIETYAAGLDPLPSGAGLELPPLIAGLEPAPPVQDLESQDTPHVAFAKRMRASANNLQRLVNRSGEIIAKGDNEPDNATKAVLKRAQTDVALVQTYCTTIADAVLPPDTVLPPNPSAPTAAVVNHPGPKTPQIAVANAVFATNFLMSIQNPQNMADYVVWVLFINTILWDDRQNPYKKEADSTETFVTNGVGMLFAIMAVSAPLIHHKDQTYFNTHPKAANNSMTCMILANLFLGNLVLPTAKLFTLAAKWLWSKTRQPANAPAIDIAIAAASDLLSLHEQDDAAEDGPADAPEDDAQATLDTVHQEIDPLTLNRDDPQLAAKLEQIMERLTPRRAAVQDQTGDDDLEDLDRNFADLLSLADRTQETTGYASALDLFATFFFPGASDQDDDALRQLLRE